MGWGEMASVHRAANRAKAKAKVRARDGQGRHRAPAPHPDVTVWLGAGALTLGVGAAMFGGSGVAHAGTDGSSGGGTSSADGSSGGGTSSTDTSAKSGSSALSGAQTGPKIVSPTATESGSTGSGAGTISGVSAGAGSTGSGAGTISGVSAGAGSTGSGAGTISGVSAGAGSTGSGAGTISGVSAGAGSTGSGAGTISGVSAGAGSTGSGAGTISGVSAGAGSTASTKAGTTMVGTPLLGTQRAGSTNLGTTGVRSTGTTAGSAPAGTATGSGATAGGFGGTAPAITAAKFSVTPPVNSRSITAALTPTVSQPIQPPSVKISPLEGLGAFVANVLLGIGGMNPANPQPANPIQLLLYAAAARIEEFVDPAPPAGAPIVGAADPNSGVVSGTAVFALDLSSDVTLTAAAKSTGGGAVQLNSTTGTFTYTPSQAQQLSAETAGVVGSDAFTVTAHDGLSTSTEKVTVPVDPGTPQAGIPTVGKPGSTGAVVGTAAFTDPAGGTLTYGSPVSSTGGGTVVVDGSGTYTYTPSQAQQQAAETAGVVGSDAFTVTASNGVHSSGVTVTVPVDPGTPQAGIPTVGKPGSTGAVVGTAAFTDPAGGTLTYGSPVSSTGGGTVVVDGSGTYTYTPSQAQQQAAETAGVVGSDAFTVTASNGVHSSGVTVTVPVDPGTPQAGIPTVGKPGSTGAVVGTAAFTDPAGGTLTYGSPVSSTGGGTVVVDGSGTYTYTPSQAQQQAAETAGVVGSDAFTVTASNGVHSSGVTVTVPVDPGTPQAGIPTVGKPGSTGAVVGTAAFTDPAGGTLTYGSPVSSTGGGTVVVDGSGTYTYTPSQAQQQAAETAGVVGSDAFTVTASNGVHSSGVTVTVPVDPGTPQAGIPTVGKPGSTGAVVGTAAFTDPAGGTLTYGSPVSSTGGGTVVVDGSGTYTYTPSQAQQQAAETAGVVGSDAFTVTASNGVHSSGVTVTVPVDPGTPQAGIPTVGKPGSTGAVVGTAAFTDPAGGTLTYGSPVSSTGGGTVVVDGSGTYTYTPSMRQRLTATGTTTDSFTVTASNGVHTASEAVTVPVAPVAEGSVIGNLTLAGAVVGSPVFSADGTNALIVLQTGKGLSAVVVDATTGALVTHGPIVLGGAGNTTVTSVALNADGIHAVVIAQTPSAKPGVPQVLVAVVDTSTGRAVGRTVTLSGTIVGSPIFSADGTHVVIATQGGTAGFSVSDVNTVTGAQTGSTITFKASTGSAVLSPDATRVVAITSTGDAVHGYTSSVAVIDPSTGTQVGKTFALNGTSSLVSPASLVFSPDGTHVVIAATKTGTTHQTALAVIDIGTGTQAAGNLTLAGAVVGSPVFSADGTNALIVLQTGKGLSAVVVDATTGALVTHGPIVLGGAGNTTVTSVALNADGIHAVVIAQTPSAKPGVPQVLVAVVDTSTGRAVGRTVTLSGTIVGSPIFSADGTHVVIATQGGTAGFSVSDVNTVTGAQTGSTITFKASTGSAVLSPDATRVVAITSTGDAVHGYTSSVAVIDPSTGTQVGKTFALNGTSSLVSPASLVFSPDGTHVVIAATKTGTTHQTALAVIDIGTGTQAAGNLTLAGAVVGSPVFSADGTNALIVLQTGKGLSAVVVDATTGALVTHGPIVLGGAGNTTVTSVALNADGIHAVVIAQTPSAKPGVPQVLVAVVDTSTGRAVGRTVTLSGTIVGSPIFSADGTHVVIATQGGTAGFSVSDVNTVTGAQTGSTITFKASTGSAVLSPDATRVVAITSTGDAVHGYTSSVAVIDPSTGTQVGKTFALNGTSSLVSPASLVFSPDGTHVVIAATKTGTTHQTTLAVLLV